MTKTVRLFIDEDFIKEKLGKEYEGCNIIFKNANIGNDNTLEFTCIATNEVVGGSGVRRIKLV